MYTISLQPCSSAIKERKQTKNRFVLSMFNLYVLSFQVSCKLSLLEWNKRNAIKWIIYTNENIDWVRERSHVFCLVWSQMLRKSNESKPIWLPKKINVFFFVIIWIWIPDVVFFPLFSVSFHHRFIESDLFWKNFSIYIIFWRNSTILLSKWSKYLRPMPCLSGLIDFGVLSTETLQIRN